MRVKVKVITNAKENSVSKRDGGLVVRTTEVPEKGKANKKVFRLLANYLNTSISKIRLVRGKTSNLKIFEY
ncbi:MAG: DUF167 domain-containing protein [Patescibacteria group bacterium]|nr:DUF167 domain-containing protein [Patescibacteria group bacterium]